ncbi:hypothetical protein [Mesorhizobium sp. ORS 3428]|uniref:hypothetical protein n=1 Tax=Mesorhizobium sp. ORS 3428 TaxID=540997 RepID=UPI0010421705|nr:hypothetical protein [Mesorhizobium sp. ORS 3428]
MKRDAPFTTFALHGRSKDFAAPMKAIRATPLTHITTIPHSESRYPISESAYRKLFRVAGTSDRLTWSDGTARRNGVCVCNGDPDL